MPSVPTPPPPPTRLSKTELISALAQELQRERARNSALEQMLEEVEALGAEAAAEAAEAEQTLIERDRAARAGIAQRQRELARLRSELESAQTVADDEAAHYLTLIHSSSDSVPPRHSHRHRRHRTASAGRAASPSGTVEDHQFTNADADAIDSPPALNSPVWTSLNGNAAERAAKRLAIVAAELGIDKNDAPPDATVPEQSTGPTTLSTGAKPRLGLHRNDRLREGGSGATSMNSGVKGEADKMDRLLSEPGEQNGRWSRLFPGLNHSFRKSS